MTALNSTPSPFGASDDVAGLAARLREDAPKFGLEEFDPTYDLRQEAARCIESQAAQLASAREARGWQPIDAAPKDGTEILLYGYGVLIGHDGLGRMYAKGRHVGWSQETKGGGIFWATRDPSVNCDATHWIPLPAPPALSPAEAGR